jgi:hypothetical protein
MVWLRRLLIPLVIASLGLPVVLVLLLATGRLLAALGDAAGATVLDRIALAGGILWAADLVILLILQSIAGLLPLDGQAEPHESMESFDEIEP